MSKHLVKWNKPERELIGKSQVPGDELIYKSKDGKFVIRKRHYASIGSRAQNSFAYVLETPEGKRLTSPIDTLDEAKLRADWEIDPNWEG